LLPRPNQFEGENIERAAGAGAGAGGVVTGRSAGSAPTAGAGTESVALSPSTGASGALFLLKKLNIDRGF